MKRQFQLNKAKLQPSVAWGDEEISSGDEDEIEVSSDSSDRGMHLESADQKRRRLAKAYLASIGDQKDTRDDENDDDDATTTRLRTNRLDAQGKRLYECSDLMVARINSSPQSISLSGHFSSVTSLALESSEERLYSGSKDNSVLMWDLSAMKKVRAMLPRWSRSSHGSAQASNGEVLSLSVTSDGRFVASGSRDGIIRIFDIRANNAEIQKLNGHRAPVSCLSFRRDSYSLFSGSFDRCIKHWDLNSMSYVETMFGHQDAVMSIDCWTKERPVSASSDRTLRVWKVTEGSHLVLRGQKASIDSVQMISDDVFFSGGQDGTLNLWNDAMKKPITSVFPAHGLEGTNPRWITSVATLKMSDVAASGSSDGFLRLWKVSAEKKAISPVIAIPVQGIINAIAMTTNLLVAGCGNEHRLGRWIRMPGGSLNKIVIFRHGCTST